MIIKKFVSYALFVYPSYFYRESKPAFGLYISRQIYTSRGYPKIAVPRSIIIH